MIKWGKKTYPNSIDIYCQSRTAHSVLLPRRNKALTPLQNVIKYTERMSAIVRTHAFVGFDDDATQHFC